MGKIGTMKVIERIKAFDKLGKIIRKLSEEELEILVSKVENGNSWFTPDNTRMAINGLSEFLDEEKLVKWVKLYHLKDDVASRSIGLMMAGNIPAVGFHDLLSVLITGHIACVKLSSSDQVLIKWLVAQLLKVEPRFTSCVVFEEMLKAKDAYIATGSDNSSRYFDYYFGKYPHIIRRNRTSVGVLSGDEKADDFKKLGLDVFQYFGLGCRNVSKLYIPHEEILQLFLDAIEGYHFIASHHKYLNNYEYNKAIYLVNKDPHLDNGFLLVKQSPDLVSPIGVLFYEVYTDQQDLKNKLAALEGKIQCVVSKEGVVPGSFDFGRAQCPNLDDYADRVDTLAFLTGLS